MSDGRISVVQGDIDAQARQLATIKNELERILNTAKTQVDTLRDSGGFKSSAGDSFQRTYEDWTAANIKSVALLDEMSTYLTKAGAAFTELDANYTLKM